MGMWAAKSKTKAERDWQQQQPATIALKLPVLTTFGPLAAKPATITNISVALDVYPQNRLEPFSKFPSIGTEA